MATIWERSGEAFNATVGGPSGETRFHLVVEAAGDKWGLGSCGAPARVSTKPAMVILPRFTGQCGTRSRPRSNHQEGALHVAGSLARRSFSSFAATASK